MDFRPVPLHFFILIFILGSLGKPPLFAQTTNESFTYDGALRVYVQHISTQYDGIEAVPLVVALHGLGDTGNNFQNIGMSILANSENFIVVYPTALVDPLLGGTAWDNDLNPFYNVDDVGFINALIDTISTHYNVDQDRVYATGFSMGAFMCHRLACELTDRFAAIASVAGTLPQPFQNNCNISATMPVMHMHGTEDQTIMYDGSFPPFITSVDATIDHWVTENGCADQPVLANLPNTSPDGLDIQTEHYEDCDADSEVLLYIINNGGHTWLGPTNDVFATEEIWEFFKRHSRSGGATSVESLIAPELDLAPNPFKHSLTLTPTDGQPFEIQLFNSIGKLVLAKQHPGGPLTLNTQDFMPGIYFLRMETDLGSTTLKVIKQ